MSIDTDDDEWTMVGQKVRTFWIKDALPTIGGIWIHLDASITDFTPDPTTPYWQVKDDDGEEFKMTRIEVDNGMHAFDQQLVEPPESWYHTAKDNDTVKKIAKELGISANDMLHANRYLWPEWKTPKQKIENEDKVIFATAASWSCQTSSRDYR